MEQDEREVHSGEGKNLNTAAEFVPCHHSLPHSLTHSLISPLSPVQWFRQASETELGKKGQDLGSRVAKTAQDAAEKVSEHAEELSKTDVAKTISKVIIQPPDRLLVSGQWMIASSSTH